MRAFRLCALLFLVSVFSFCPSYAAQAQDSSKPNILVIWGDDIGQSNLSAYTFRLVGKGVRVAPSQSRPNSMSVMQPEWRTGLPSH
jgi:hypothetical protein